MFDYFTPSTDELVTTVCDFDQSHRIRQRRSIKFSEMRELQIFYHPPAPDSYRWM
ncbi:MAG: hypothetical protein Q9181_005858 [Wetmoreana brouardii]